MSVANAQAGVKRYFYASSACVYNETVQDRPENPGLIESDAWPAQPQDTCARGGGQVSGFARRCYPIREACSKLVKSKIQRIKL